MRHFLLSLPAAAAVLCLTWPLQTAAARPPGGKPGAGHAAGKTATGHMVHGHDVPTRGSVHHAPRRPHTTHYSPTYHSSHHYRPGHSHLGFYLNLGRGWTGHYRGYYSPWTSYYRGGYRPYYYDTYYYNYTSPYGIYYNPRSAHVEYYLPPLHQPAELMYGPQAINQFLGVDRRFGLGALAPREDEKRKVPAIKPIVRESPDAARERSGRYIEFGDARFRSLEHHAALQRYKTAVTAAPDLAGPYFRKGIAAMVLGHKNLAMDAFKRGLAIDPAWPRGDFRLESLYDGARVAKTVHVESLARAALENPRDADAIYLLGVFLYLDDQRERSQKFFRRAAELSADDAHIRPFLPAPKTAEKKDGAVAL